MPNDPRGSSSHEIRVEQIAELGELHHGRKTVQPPAHVIREFYDEARKVLKHPLLTFTSADIGIIADAFLKVVFAERYTCYACAVLREHVHVLIRKHKHHAETMIASLQEQSKTALVAANRRDPNHPVWGGPGWKVFLFTQEDMRRIVGYIQGNPRKHGLPDQNWDFVKEYDGWMPGNPGAKR